MDDKLERVKQIIATLFNVDEATLTIDSSTANVPEWDSMGQLMLVLELEQQFEIEIAPEKAEKLTSISAIIKLIESAE